MVASVLSVQPNLVAARCWLSTLRRVHHVEIVETPTGTFCAIVGTGNRRPVVRHISHATAAGLADLGVTVIERRSHG